MRAARDKHASDGATCRAQTPTRERKMAVAHDNRFVHLSIGNRTEVTALAVPQSREKEATAAHLARGSQVFASGTFENVVHGAVVEVPQGDRASERLGLGMTVLTPRPSSSQ